MRKLVALYKEPEDTEAFEEAYFGQHIPLVEKVPGLRRTKITRIYHTLRGEGYHLMAELYFEDEAALKAGMTSPEMLAAGENLDSFAKDQYVLMFGTED